ncbi:MAG: helix-turn-helix transcriptional regulator [Bacteroidales bacterium]|nr:helix-turn-helix transcriptional regulator [Anaerotignum sp.]MCI5679700.1 helix-turn-helix transcriptional regulator [Bacteroidales bacterium]MDY3925715.1 helix-turn-helix transcriptional regulator [Anaerotignum sp.]
MDKTKAGKRLRELRIERGETLEYASAAIGISRSALAMYELGERAPRDEVKVKLSKYYGKGIEEIFFAD